MLKFQPGSEALMGLLKLFFNASIKVMMVTLMFLLSSTIRAETASEAQLKTAYLYNFSRFVQWPDDNGPQERFSFCIYPQNRFGDVLLKMEKMQIQEKAIKIIELTNVKQIKDCHAIFIDTVPEEKLFEALAIATENHVLTISDLQDFAVNGGMIQMFIVDGKIRFNINYDSSQKAELKINSKLIKLASNVIRTTL